MYILGIDSTKQLCRICLYASDNDSVLLKEIDDKKISENLISEIHNFVNNVGINLSEIVGIVVNVGPGSFTGLRVGIATGKGLSKALNCHYSEISLIECLSEIVLEKDIEDVLVLLNLGKKGIVLFDPFEILDNGNLELLSKESVEIFLSESNKKIYTYNLSDQLLLDDLEEIASDNVIKKLTELANKYLLEKKLKKQKTIYL